MLKKFLLQSTTFKQYQSSCFCSGIHLLAFMESNISLAQLQKFALLSKTLSNINLHAFALAVWIELITRRTFFQLSSHGTTSCMQFCTSLLAQQPLYHCTVERNSRYTPWKTTVLHSATNPLGYSRREELHIFQSASLRISLAMLICYASSTFVRSRSSPLPAAKHLLQLPT